MKKIFTALKATRVFGSLSDAFVSAAIANAKVVEVAAGALIMKVLSRRDEVVVAATLCSYLYSHPRFISHALEHLRLAKWTCPVTLSIRLWIWTSALVSIFLDFFSAPLR
jgi:hypothetical protein